MSTSSFMAGALALALLVMPAAHVALAQPRPPVIPATGDEGFALLAPLSPETVVGTNLQHSLRLLAGLRCEGNRPVRVLFYGQSITEQGWWETLAKYLAVTYPNTPLLIENRAIGGHASDLLVKTAEADLYTFNPDLVIFHVYGSPASYEAIIRRIRERTTADVMIASDHVVSDLEITEETNSRLLWFWRWTKWASWFWSQRSGMTWSAWMNYSFLPSISSEYKVELVDVRSQWKSYLKINHLKATQLLADSVHLNTQGEYLMAEIFKNYLIPQRLKYPACQYDRGKEWVAGKDFLIEHGSVRLPFYGSRAEVVLGRPTKGKISVSVDGRLPSETRGVYVFTRASPYPTSNWPGLLEVHFGASRPVAESWTATISKANDAITKFEFSVEGSVTGKDGVGVSSVTFVSKSGRVTIEPSDWNLAYAREVFKISIAEDYKITWKVLDLSKDEIGTGVVAVYGVDIVRGLENTSHILNLSGVGVAEITAIRTYRPPLH